MGGLTQPARTLLVKVRSINGGLDQTAVKVKKTSDGVGTSLGKIPGEIGKYIWRVQMV